MECSWSEAYTTRRTFAARPCGVLRSADRSTLAAHPEPSPRPRLTGVQLEEGRHHQSHPIHPRRGVPRRRHRRLGRRWRRGREHHLPGQDRNVVGEEGAAGTEGCEQEGGHDPPPEEDRQPLGHHRGVCPPRHHRVPCVHRGEGMADHSPRKLDGREAVRQEPVLDSEWPLPVPDLDIRLYPLREGWDVDLESVREQSRRWLDAPEWPGERVADRDWDQR